MNNIYDIWFARVNVANSIKKKLYKSFSTKEIFEMKKENFLEIGLKEISAEKFLSDQYKNGLEKYEKYMNQNRIKQIMYGDDEYPNKLKQALDAPTYIFAKRRTRAFR